MTGPGSTASWLRELWQYLTGNDASECLLWGAICSIPICSDAKTDRSRNWIWTGPMQVLATQDSLAAKQNCWTWDLAWPGYLRGGFLCLGWMTSRGWTPYGYVNLQLAMIVGLKISQASRTCVYFFLETFEKKNQNFQCFLAFYNISFSCQLSQLPLANMTKIQTSALSNEANHLW